MRVTIERIRDEISDRIEVVTAWTYGMTGGRSGKNRRLAGSTVFVLMIHALFFWGLMVTHPRNMNLPTFDDPPLEVELYDVPPPEPEPVPVPKPVVDEDVRPVETPREQPVEQPPERPIETPQPVEQPQPQTVPAPPQPTIAENPRPSTTVKPVEIPDFTTPRSPTVRQQTQRDVTADNRSAPTVTPTPTASLGVKKKNKDEDLQAKATATASQSDTSRDVTALNLHEPPRIAPDAPASPIAPSGLANSGSKPAGGGSNTTLPPGALQGANGSLKGGRSGVAQAIQNHNSCVSIQQKGKPIPQGCNMADMNAMGNLGPKPDADFQAAAARRDANLRYKTDARSTEYWQRVNAAPQPGSAGRDDGLPQKGAYSGAKDQRVMNGSNTDPKSGN